MERRQFPTHDRANCMDHILTWQIKSRRYLSHSCRFFMPLLFHQVATVISKLDTGMGMDTIIYTIMAGLITACHAAVGCIHNRTAGRQAL